MIKIIILILKIFINNNIYKKNREVNIGKKSIAQYYLIIKK